jgi:hypothetical protein
MQESQISGGRGVLAINEPGVWDRVACLQLHISTFPVLVSAMIVRGSDKGLSDKLAMVVE